MSDLIQGTITPELESQEIKALKAKMYSIEKREKKSMLDLKAKFAEIYQKFKIEMNKKVDLKDENIHKLKLKIAELETENKKIMFITSEKHTKEKTELENVILKQEELIENLYKKNDNLIKTIHDKNKEINTLKLKLKDEEFINRKNRVFENSIVGVHNSLAFSNKNLNSGALGYNNSNNGLIDSNNALDRSMINKIGEVEYFKGLNKNLQEQIKASENVIKNYEQKIFHMSEELEELKKLRQKFERFEHSYIQNFKNQETINEQGEKTLNLENTVNEENLNNMNHILHTEYNENFKLNVTSNKYMNDIANSVIIENEEEKNLSSKDNRIRNSDQSQTDSSAGKINKNISNVNEKTRDILKNVNISQIKNNADIASTSAIGNSIDNNDEVIDKVNEELNDDKRDGINAY